MIIFLLHSRFSIENDTTLVFDRRKKNNFDPIPSQNVCEWIVNNWIRERDSSEQSAEFIFEWPNCFIFESTDGQQDQIPAHKTLLAARSDEFEAMFYGTVKEKGDIKIVNVTAAAFKEFLQFFYLSLTNKNIAYVINLVNKYNIISGMNFCVSFRRDPLTVHNVCNAYELAILYEQEY